MSDPIALALGAIGTGGSVYSIWRQRKREGRQDAAAERANVTARLLTTRDHPPFKEHFFVLHNKGRPPPAISVIN